MSEIDPRIAAAIPHRPPMLLVDSIVEQSAAKIVCQKTFAASEYFFDGHFPGQPLVPGVILCECALQAGAVLAASLPNTDDQSGSSRLPVATRIDNVKFKQMVRPGDTILIAVELTEQLSNAFFMSGKITVGGKLAARLDFACALTPSGS